jgi:hypothetical protein
MDKDSKIKRFCMLYQLTPIDLQSLKRVRINQLSELILKSGAVFENYHYKWFFYEEIPDKKKDDCIRDIIRILKGSIDLEIDLIKMSKKDIQKIWTMINNVLSCPEITEEEKEEKRQEKEKMVRLEKQKKEKELNEASFFVGKFILFIVWIVWIVWLFWF